MSSKFAAKWVEIRKIWGARKDIIYIIQQKKLNVCINRPQRNKNLTKKAGKIVIITKGRRDGKTTAAAKIDEKAAENGQPFLQ